jgi:dUTP pyrophosphatase
MTDPVLEWKRVSPRAAMPAYQTDGAAGIDLAACLNEDMPYRLAPFESFVFPTGWAVAIPPGYEGQVRVRSGLATKHGVVVPNAPGTIDSDYRGELKVALLNLSRDPFEVTHGMRIAQLVIAPIVRAEFRIVEELGQTLRGSGGFGSTGL